MLKKNIKGVKTSKKHVQLTKLQDIFSLVIKMLTFFGKCSKILLKQMSAEDCLLEPAQFSYANFENC